MTQRTTPSRRALRASVLGAASTLLLVACDAGTDAPSTVDGLPATGEIKLQLTRADSCEDLLLEVQDSILVQLGERAKELRSGQGNDGGPVRGVATGNAGVDASGPAVAPGAPVSTAPPANGGTAEETSEVPTADPRPSAPGTAQGESDSAAPGSGFSGTTVQVKDVDEADIVKADGDLIYLLHGGTLFVLRGWPANSTEILASARVEGQPTEMFVRDGKAVVFSTVYGELAAQGTGAADPYGYYYGSSSYTKLTVLDVTGEVPSVVRESYVEGDYVSARRHDGIVRAVVQDGFKVPQLGNPSIEYRDLFGQPYPQADVDAQVDAWLDRTVRSVRNTDLGDWLPRELARVNGQLVAQAPRCADYYSPDPGLTETGVTSVVSLDLDDVAAPFRGATILGRAERVYSNEDVVLITQSDYRFAWDAAATEQTIIHRFDITGSATSYTASGAVAGTIHDQFSLDERDGIIRVSTTEQSFGRFFGPVDLPVGAPEADVAIAPVPPERPAGPKNRVVTLQADGALLEQLGATEDFGLTESIFATRFIGDRGYVVTFRQTDPLFVVDLSDPTNPSVVGELHIPGFSNYLFPLDDDHLFAIGRDATADGRVQGLSLQIFDVSDPAAPTLAHRHTYPNVGDSPANIDHRAISFHPAGDVLAFPYQDYNTGESTLEIFTLSAAAGFTRLGGMGMSDTPSLEQCLITTYGYDPATVSQLVTQAQNDPAWQREILASCRWNQHFKRGLFRDNYVYGIGNTGVYAYDLGALDAGAVGEVSLPAEVYDYGNYAQPGATTPSSGGRPDIAVPPMATATPPSGAGTGGSAGTSPSMKPETDSAAQ